MNFGHIRGRANRNLLGELNSFIHYKGVNGGFQGVKRDCITFISLQKGAWPRAPTGVFIIIEGGWLKAPRPGRRVPG